jgi:hypothetical protein
MDKTKNKIIEELYNDKNFNKLFIYKANTSWNKDLKQEIFEYLLTVDERRIKDLYYRDELNKYVHQIIKNSSNRNSRFYQKIIKKDEKTVYFDDISNNDGLDIYNEINPIDELNLYEFVTQGKFLSYTEMEFFIYYYDLKKSWIEEVSKSRSYREIAKAFECNSMSIKKTFDKMRTKILNHLQQDEIYSKYVTKEFIEKFKL